MKTTFAFPTSKIDYYKKLLAATLKDKTKNLCSAGHVIDAYERVGIALFYSGSYKECLEYFANANLIKRPNPKSRRDAYAAILVGASYYRLYQFEEAEKWFSNATSIASVYEENKDLKAHALTNLAIVNMKFNNHLNALEHAQQAVQTAESISEAHYDKNKLLQHQKILIGIHIKCRNFSHALEMIESNAILCPEEKALLLAGCYYADNKHSQARIALMSYRDKRSPFEMFINTNNEADDTKSSDPYMQLLRSQIEYNLAIVSTSSNTKQRIAYMENAHEAIQKYLDETRKQHANELYFEDTFSDSKESDPFLRTPYGKTVNCISFDRSLQPLVVLSQILDVKVELETKSMMIDMNEGNPVSSIASKIQGGMILTGNSYSLACERIQTKLKEDMEASVNALSNDTIRHYRLNDTDRRSVSRERFRESILQVNRPLSSSDDNQGQKKREFFRTNKSDLILSRRPSILSEKPMTDDMSSRPTTADTHNSVIIRSNGYDNNNNENTNTIVDAVANEDRILSYQALFDMLAEPTPSTASIVDALSSSMNQLNQSSAPFVATTKAAMMRMTIAQMKVANDENASLRPSSAQLTKPSIQNHRYFHPIGNKSMDILKRRYNYDMTLAMKPNQASTPLTSRPSTAKKLQYDMKKIDNTLHIINETDSTTSNKTQSIIENKNQIDMNFVNDNSNQKDIIYNSNKHDQSTIRSELLLSNIDTIGHDEISLWITWALSMIDGFGYGIFGTASTMNYLTNHHHQLPNSPSAISISSNISFGYSKTSKLQSPNKNQSNGNSNQLSYIQSSIHHDSNNLDNINHSNITNIEFIQEIKSILNEIELLLEKKAIQIITNESSNLNATSTTTFSSKTNDYQIISKNRFLLSLILIKISYLLNNRNDMGKYMKNIDTLYYLATNSSATTMGYGLRLPSNYIINPMIDYHYIAISKRFRLQYEEWTCIITKSEKKFQTYISVILPLGKEYMKFASLGNDMIMLRDSMKSLMNVYIEISKLPCVSEEEIAANNSRISPLASKNHRKDSITQNNILMNSFITIDELERQYSFEQNEIKENESPYWVRYVSKARAQQIFRKMRTLQ